ncbi:Uncharacterized protein HZ326_27937 [Fusarium oxysporum f. sp. albedinis]|nr:Uncharacterized protein HZ326_27937 [Fusarium oxysporum f. sp. albedinis]
MSGGGRRWRESKRVARGGLNDCGRFASAPASPSETVQLVPWYSSHQTLLSLKSVIALSTREALANRKVPTRIFLGALDRGQAILSYFHCTDDEDGAFRALKTLDPA